MNRLKDLNMYQKFILILLLVMVVFFAVVYRKTIFTVGYLYENEILVPSQDNGNTIYSGKIDGKQAKFIVTKENAVEFYYGDKVYGPYTVTEDETAIPEEEALAEFMKGIEIRCKEQIIFRGGVRDQGSHLLFYGDGGNVNVGLSYAEMVANKALAQNGANADPMEPTKHTIYELVTGPDLIHKGIWGVWCAGVVVSLVIAISILFADELFRLRLRYYIRDVEDAEPSTWEMTIRYTTWTASIIIIVAIYVLGLNFLG